MILIDFLEGQKAISGIYYKGVLNKLKNCTDEKTTREAALRNSVPSRERPSTFFKSFKGNLTEISLGNSSTPSLWS